MLWKQQKFLTSSGIPIKKNRLQVDKLLSATWLPSEMAIIKIKAHACKTEPEHKRNALEDIPVLKLLGYTIN